MELDLDRLTPEEICRGYTGPVGDNTAPAAYTCLACGQRFEQGEIYPMEGRLLEAARAVQAHLRQAHPDYLAGLIDGDSKYNTLTQNQRGLLHLFAAGHSDKEVAKVLGVAVSTVRHQKFMFREKAKQATLYLALWQAVQAAGATEEGSMMPVHEHARMVDERFMVTEEERARILKNAFSSLQPMRLRNFPPKEKKKVVILNQIITLFEKGRDYTEREVNAILGEVFADYVTLRRYMIQYGFMERERDGSRYWLP